jgi:hypothetical protein
MPLGCGFKKVLTGIPEKESQTINIESSPQSAVTIHLLSSEQAVALI